MKRHLVPIFYEYLMSRYLVPTFYKDPIIETDQIENANPVLIFLKLALFDCPVSARDFPFR